MIKNYLTVRTAGFVTYCDALIARAGSEILEAYFLSLIGTPAHIKASSAILFSGETCRIASQDEPQQQLGFPEAIRTCRSRKIGETVNKIMVSGSHFPESGAQSSREEVVFGADIATVQERAFLRLDAATAIPLKTQWQGWLWDEVLQPEKLYSFGGDELKEAYLIRWPEDDILQQQILTGVRQRYLN
jgi:hypothetical protein